nr:hypothetical protein [Rhizobium laguerreae]
MAGLIGFGLAMIEEVHARERRGQHCCLRLILELLYPLVDPVYVGFGIFRVEAESWLDNVLKTRLRHIGRGDDEVPDLDEIIEYAFHPSIGRIYHPLSEAHAVGDGIHGLHVRAHGGGNGPVGRVVGRRCDAQARGHLLRRVGEAAIDRTQRAERGYRAVIRDDTAHDRPRRIGRARHEPVCTFVGSENRRRRLTMQRRGQGETTLPSGLFVVSLGADQQSIGRPDDASEDALSSSRCAHASGHHSPQLSCSG